MAPAAPFHSSASRALRRCTIAAHWWHSKFQANIVTSKRTTVSYVSGGTHPAAWPRRKPRPSVCPESCPAIGGLGNLMGSLGNKRMRERFLAELRLKPPVCRGPESLLIIYNTPRDNLRNFQNYG